MELHMNVKEKSLLLSQVHYWPLENMSECNCWVILYNP